MENLEINHLAVLVAAVFNLVLGGLWYSPALFYKAWKKENNLSDEDLKKQNPVKVYGLAFFISLIMSCNMAFFSVKDLLIGSGEPQLVSSQGLAGPGQFLL